MKKLLLALVLLVVAAGLVAEVLTPRLVEARIEERVADNTEGRVTVEANVQSFPFLPGLAVDGKIRRLTLTLDDVFGQQLPADASFGLEGIHLNRRALLEGTVEVRDVDRGTVTVEVTEQTLSDALGVPVDIRPDAVVLSPAGVSVEADLAVEAGNVVISAAEVGGLDVPLPENLPCEPVLEQEEGLVRLSCGFEGLPAILAQAIAA